MRYLVILLSMMFFAGSALGSKCHSLINQIDEQLQLAQPNGEAEARIKALRDQGESLQNQG